MKRLRFFLVLSMIFCRAALPDTTTTLQQRATGETITQSFFNDLTNALNGTLVPRHATTGAPTANSDLGSTTYPWGILYLSDGSAAAPSRTYGADSNTGDYRIGANNWGLSTDGVLRFDVSTTYVTSTLPIKTPAGSGAAVGLAVGGDVNTGLFLSSADDMRIAAGGVTGFIIQSAAVVSPLPHAFADGSAAAPSIYHDGDTNNGLYFGTDIINYSTAGTLRGSISAAGLFTIGSASGTQVHVVNGTINLLAGSADAYSARFRSSTTTDSARVAVNNSDATRGFEFKGVFGAGTEQLTLGSDSADLMYLNRAGTVVTFPNIGTTATGAGAATLLNAPAGAAGNPDIWINLTVGGTVYVIPAWTP